MPGASHLAVAYNLIFNRADRNPRSPPGFSKSPPGFSKSLSENSIGPATELYSHNLTGAGKALAEYFFYALRTTLLAQHLEHINTLRQMIVGQVCTIEQGAGRIGCIIANQLS